MPFSTVLNVVGVNQSDKDIQMAIDLCAEIKAHLSVLVMAMAAPPPAGQYAAVMSEAWMREREADVARLESRVEQISELVADADLPSDVASEYAELTWADEVIGQRARYADMTVLGPELASDGGLKLRAVNGGLFKSGRPLVIVPADTAPTLRPKTVLLAWDSRIEAARAVREAIDLMAGAARVHVTLVDPDGVLDDEGPEPGADVATYLARHGCKVVVDRLPSLGHTIAGVLRQHAVDVGADFVVMGAYGHSRLRERIFGGVTQSMLDDATVPLFMAR